MLIAHNPGMQELAVSLTGGSHDRLNAGFPTAALAEFAVATQWQQLAAAGARLVRFLTPSDLQEPAT
jgi:phosphohistidine phosphatase